MTPPPDTNRLETHVGRVLRAGALLSTSVLVVGLVLRVALPASGVPDTILRAGLIILIATPVARVVASVIDYTLQRDWLFAALTLAVLVVLLGSLLYGIRTGR
jgi:uncharacterized membrane protein